MLAGAKSWVKTKERSPRTTPWRAPAINHGCQSSCAHAPWWELAPELYIIWSYDECTSFTQVLLIRGHAMSR